MSASAVQKFQHVGLGAVLTLTLVGAIAAAWCVAGVMVLVAAAQAVTSR